MRRVAELSAGLALVAACVVILPGTLIVFGLLELLNVIWEAL